MHPGGLTIEPGGSDINPSVQSKLEEDSGKEVGIQPGRDPPGERPPVESAPPVLPAKAKSSDSQSGASEELQHRAKSPFGEHIVTRGQPHYRRELPAFRSSPLSSRSSLRSPLMGVEEFIGDQLSPRQASHTSPLRMYRGASDRSRKSPRSTGESRQSTYNSHLKDARELFAQHGISPPSGWLSGDERHLQLGTQNLASPRGNWRICHVCKARIRSRTFCTSCGHPLCQTCTCPIPKGADEIHQDFLANRGAHLSIRSGEVYTSYPGSVPSSPGEGRDKTSDQRLKKLKTRPIRHPPDIRRRTTSVRDNPFVIADRITKARTVAAQATPVSVTANRKLSEYVPHRADYMREPHEAPGPQTADVSSQGDCNDPTCRATHEGHRPYRHSIGCTVYKEAHGKRPSEIIEHVPPMPEEFAHQHQCPNTLETTTSSEYQRSEDFPDAQHIRDHLAAAARWHAAHQAHTPQRDKYPHPHGARHSRHPETHLTDPSPTKGLSMIGSRPPEHLQNVMYQPEETNYHIDEAEQKPWSPLKETAGPIKKHTVTINPRNRFNAHNYGPKGPGLIRAKSPTSWLRKNVKETSSRNRTLPIKVGSAFIPPRIQPEGERLNFAEIRSRLKHRDMDKPVIGNRDPVQKMRSSTPPRRSREPQRGEHMHNRSPAPQHASEKSLMALGQHSRDSPHAGPSIVAPEPQSYQLYYAFSATFESSESSPDEMSSDEYSGFNRPAPSVSDSSRGDIVNRGWVNSARNPAQDLQLVTAPDGVRPSHFDGLVEPIHTEASDVGIHGQNHMLNLWLVLAV